MENIEHVVVVMMENRSLDNLLGWLYDADHPPAFNIPPQSPTTFAGLSPDTYSNAFNGKTVFASRPPTGWPPSNNPSLVPTPDPQEEFDHISAQIFGTASPGPDAKPVMSGFFSDYATTERWEEQHC